MNCNSCKEEVSTKFRHSLESNICPFCGNGIMDENLKDLLSTLRATMEELSEYPEQLNDWMLSNHNYIKTDADNLVSFVPQELLKTFSKNVQKESDEDFQERKGKKFKVKVTTENGEQEVEVQKIQSQERNDAFFKRAEAVKPNIDGFSSALEKTQHLKSIAQKIKRGGMEIGGEDSSEMMEGDLASELRSMISGDEVDNSQSDFGSDEEKIPSIVMNMANKASSRKDPNDDLRKLQEMHQKSQRSSFGGGFSRS